MAMKTIIGVFESRSDAERAISELIGVGVPQDSISYAHLAEDETTIVEAGADKDEGGSGAGRGAAAGATTGGIIGAVAGLVVANGILPGLGTLFVAGPLAAALGLTGAAATTAAGAMTGAAAGGILGALAGLGVHAEDARSYEERVRRGGILMSVRSEKPAVKDVMRANHAEDVREYDSATQRA